MADRALIMGIVNVTPDSFSDGGLHATTDAAVAHGLRLVAEGADIVDVGGESTRPGATRVDEATEAARTLPVVRRLASAGVTVSVDTMRASIARRAVEAGASIINDVTGGLADPNMAEVAASTGVRFVCSHWRKSGGSQYDDVVAQVCSELAARVGALKAAGVRREQIVVDPGLGFVKELHHNWDLLASLDRLVALGYPVLVGASRKRFLANLVGDDLENRDAATVAVSAIAATKGAWCLRVHSVRANYDAVKVAARWVAVSP